jgi:PAS domain S-box-containing protein
VPIVLLVGMNDEELGTEAVERGALDYLVKQQVVSNLLEKSLRYAAERTHTMLALRASEARYRELYENVVAGVFQSTPDGKFMSANPALVKLLGYESEDELLGLDIGRDLYMYPEDRENWIRNIRESGEIRNAELILKRKDGRKIVVLENSRAVCNGQGEVLYYEGTLTDITEAHELSRQLSYEASHDALTGPSTPEFELRLQRTLESVQTGGGPRTRCVISTSITSRSSTIPAAAIAGDEVLRQLAPVLQQHIRSRIHWHAWAAMSRRPAGRLPLSAAGLRKTAARDRAVSVRGGALFLPRPASAWCDRRLAPACGASPERQRTPPVTRPGSGPQSRLCLPRG